MVRSAWIDERKFKIAMEQIVKIGYDEIADDMYRNLKENDTIFINGRINSKMQVEVYNI